MQGDSHIFLLIFYEFYEYGNMESLGLRSSKNNRVEAIMSALKEAHDDARALSGCSLNRMPEYFLGTRVADYFAKHFPNLGYRLEMSVSQTLADAGLGDEKIEKLMENENLRGNGRFDLVLHSGRRRKPAHIIEFKKGQKPNSLAMDINRLALVCDAVESSSRLETNYLVLVTRRHAKRTEDDWRTELKTALGEITKDEKRDYDIDWDVVRFEQIEPATNPEYQDTDKPFSMLIIEIRPD